MGEAGWEGWRQDWPERCGVTPHKARRNHPLTEDPNWIHRELSLARIVVANILVQRKHFRALAERFRHSLEIHDNFFSLSSSPLL